MQRRGFIGLVGGAAAWPLVALLLLPGGVLAEGKENFVGSAIDVRTVLAFKASDAAVQKMLPAGWEINSPTAGPTKGFNVAVVLIDQQFALDADGKPAPLFRGAAIAIPAKKASSDSSGNMIFDGFAGPGVSPGAYGVYANSAVVIDRKVRTDAEGKSTSEETWDLKSDNGSALEVQISYSRSAPAWAKVEAKNYSAAKPDFYRIYRQEQIVDVVRGVDRADRVTKFSFKASGPKLTQLFDGSEQLIGIISIPSYSRQTFLPGS
jgi:hypothetical protein